LKFKDGCKKNGQHGIPATKALEKFLSQAYWRIQQVNRDAIVNLVLIIVQEAQIANRTRVVEGPADRTAANDVHWESRAHQNDKSQSKGGEVTLKDKLAGQVDEHVNQGDDDLKHRKNEKKKSQATSRSEGVGNEDSRRDKVDYCRKNLWLK
jgi:hypothetical protein